MNVLKAGSENVSTIILLTILDLISFEYSLSAAGMLLM